MDFLRYLGLIGLLALPACGPSGGMPDGAGGSAGMASGGASGSAGSTGQVELGLPGGPDSLDFTPMADGAELRLETFGQGGTHVLLGVRCIGFGNRAFVSIRVRNLIDDSEIVAPAPARPQLLFCDGDVCDLVPLTMMMGGISDAAERDGLAVEVTAEVHNQAGISGSDSRHAVLSTVDL